MNSNQPPHTQQVQQAYPQQYGQPQQAYPQVHVVHYQAPQTSGMCVMAMILGIFSIIGGGLLVVPAIFAVILGHCGLSACAQNPNVRGSGMAITGLIFGYICLGIWAIIVLVLIGGLF